MFIQRQLPRSQGAQKRQSNRRVWSMADGLVQQDPLTAAAKQSAEPRELGLVLVSFTFILVCYLYIFLSYTLFIILSQTFIEKFLDSINYPHPTVHGLHSAIMAYFCKTSILFKCMHFIHRYRTSPTSTAPPAYSPTECQRRQPSRGTSL